MHLHFNKIRTDVVGIRSLRVYISVPLLCAVLVASGWHEEEFYLDRVIKE